MSAQSIFVAHGLPILHPMRGSHAAPPGHLAGTGVWTQSLPPKGPGTHVSSVQSMLSLHEVGVHMSAMSGLVASMGDTFTPSVVAASLGSTEPPPSPPQPMTKVAQIAASMTIPGMPVLSRPHGECDTLLVEDVQGHMMPSSVQLSITYTRRSLVLEFANVTACPPPLGSGSG